MVAVFLLVSVRGNSQDIEPRRWSHLPIGGESTIDGTPADDRKGDFGWGLSMGIPVNRSLGFKLAYIGIRTDQDTGADTDTFAIAFAYQW